MLNRIHHINFVVHDLDQGINLYEKLGLGPFLKDTLKKRDALTARTRIGDSWLVLVQPTDAQGAPGRHLAEHGEGFFLISFETDDLNEEKSRLSEAGINFDPPNNRQGLLNWQVCDIDARSTFGALIQLTEEDKQSNST